ncbi:MAG: hypothetical protein HY038_13325 [Nitrospirae bacterium]|jgi:hypothetical protein|nr:hypothetical protein [Nitrospirota bacterium]
MAKKTATESEEARLKKKVLAKRAGPSNPEADDAMRALRKRLKREQRKRRALALRKKHAAGNKSAATAPASA